jgi:hypothetical protein
MATLQKRKKQKQKRRPHVAHSLIAVNPWGRLCPLDVLQPPLAAAHRLTIAGLVFNYASCVPGF